MKDLENRIKMIEERNKKVELDKKWETSYARIISIVILTYIIATTYFLVVDTTSPFLSSIVPCMGFFLSTLTLKFIRKFWSLKNN